MSQNDMGEVTESVCPECLKKVEARRVIRGNDVFLEKTCPEHGLFSALIWSGEPGFESWKRPKIPKTPPITFRGDEKGCPYDCGLCSEHRQRSCTVILEVTERCNLSCPVCYASSSNEQKADPSFQTISGWYQRARMASEGSNIQLSGGEPTLRDDLPEIVAMGRESGFDFIQINTNGVRAARDKAYVKALKDAGLSSAFLQFDGLDDEIYKTLRGRKLLDEKLTAIDNLGENDIGVVLVPVITPGVNVGAVGGILRFALEKSPVVRAVHFQPLSYFGRYFSNDESGGDKKRFTLPELLREIESQSEGIFKTSHFKPPGCENARCSFHGNFIVMPGGKVKALQKEGSCCGPPIKAEKGAEKAISYVSRQWSSPDKQNACCSEPAADNGGLLTLDEFISRAKTYSFSVSAMAFQDAWNLDLERARDCCIHVMSPDGMLVPFCLYNLTAADGKTLYRK